MRQLLGMGRFWKKVYFCWLEPLAVKRMRQRTDPAYLDERRKFRRFQFLAWLHVVGMIGLVALIEGQKAPNAARRPSIWAVLLVASAAGFVFVYLVPWLSSWSAGLISVDEKGIWHSSGHAQRRWNYDRIKSCTLSRQQIDNQTYEVLAVTDDKDQTQMLGLDSSVPTEQLVARLRELGVEVKEWPGEG